MDLNEIYSISYYSKIVPIKPINEQMTLCKCYIMACGKNSNKTEFSKKTVENAIESIYNIPVVGHLYVNEDGKTVMGAHDVDVVKNKDGKYEFKRLTIPLGVVPKQDNVHFEEIEDKDKNKVEYLVADIILWTGRYPELLDAKYNEDIYFAQSMEVDPIETKKKKDTLEVTKFQFSALCLLGKSDDKSINKSPCFDLARVEPYEFSKSEDSLLSLFEEFKNELSKCSYAKIINNEEGEKMKVSEDFVNKLKLEFGLTETDELSFEISEDMTEENVRLKFSEVYSKQSNIEQNEGSNYASNNEGAEGQATIEPNAVLKFSIDLTNNEKYSKICDELSKLYVWNEDMYCSYSLIDFTESDIFAKVRKSGKNIEDIDTTMKIPYEMNEDLCLIKTDLAVPVRLVWVTKEEEEKISAEKVELEELKEYKKCKTLEEKQKQYSEIITEFAELTEQEEYKNIVKNAMEFSSADELSEKLYALRGKLLSVKNLKAKENVGNIRFPINFEKKEINDSEAKQFMENYLAKQNN